MKKKAFTSVGDIASKRNLKIIAVLLVACALTLGALLYRERVRADRLLSKYQNALQEQERLENISMHFAEKASLLQKNITKLKEIISEKDKAIKVQLSEIKRLQKELERAQNRIGELEIIVERLEVKLGITQEKLEETTGLYEEAKPYMDRVDQGQSLFQSYSLLGDYNDFAQPIALGLMRFDAPITPVSGGGYTASQKIWKRGELVYNWLSDNYNYCGDKDLRVGSTFYGFQFFSPDELLKSDNKRCGDCDDYATLFAGMMYASGVPYDKVWVVCGDVPSGGHCWNWIVLDGHTYRIDPGCSREEELFSILGWGIGMKGASYPVYDYRENVDCFSEYSPEVKMNPDGFHVI